MGKFIITEEERNSIKKLYLMEQPTGNTPTLTFKVVTNNWGELPKTFKANLVSKGAGGGLYFGRFGMANSAQLDEYYKKNINTLTDDGYICYTANNTMYLIGVNIDNGQIGANDCTVERGNAADITKSPEYNSYTKLPSGSTEYMIVKKPYDKDYSFLGVLKGGAPCWNFLYSNMSSQYGNMSKCWL